LLILYTLWLILELRNSRHVTTSVQCCLV
jgi:hypothetical protein